MELSCVESIEATQETSFVVELRSADGSLCHSTHDLQNMTVKMTAVSEVKILTKPMKEDEEDEDEDDEEKEEEAEDVLVHCDVQEKTDGKYQVVFTPLFPGKYEAEVKVREKHISNSPFTFVVKTRYFNHLKTLGNEMQFGGKPLKTPIGVSVSKQDFVAVCDAGNSRVVVLDDQLKYVREIGREGSGDGELKNPFDVTFDNKGNIVVADESNNTVQFFKLTGEFIKKIGSEGQGDGQFDGPRGVFVDENDRLMVCDENKVQVFDSEGNFQKHLKTQSDPFNCNMYITSCGLFPLIMACG